MAVKSDWRELGTGIGSISRKKGWFPPSRSRSPFSRHVLTSCATLCYITIPCSNVPGSTVRIPDVQWNTYIQDVRIATVQSLDRRSGSRMRAVSDQVESSTVSNQNSRCLLQLSSSSTHFEKRSSIWSVDFLPRTISFSNWLINSTIFTLIEQRRQAHENPAIFWSVAIGVMGESPSFRSVFNKSIDHRSRIWFFCSLTGPVLLATVPPIRRNYFGYKSTEQIPGSYPRQSNPISLWTYRFEDRTEEQNPLTFISFPRFHGWCCL